MSVILRPARLPIEIAAGDDFSLPITVTENGTPYSWTGATVTTSIVALRGGEVSTVALDHAEAAGGLLTLSLSDTDTDDLGMTTWRYWVAVTKGGVTRTWLAGNLVVGDPADGVPYTSPSTATLELTETDVVLELNVMGGLTLAEVTAQFVPLATDRLWIPKSSFETGGGSPAESGVGWLGSTRVWLFDKDVQEYVTTSVVVPPHWATFDVDFYWTNPGAGTGDVRWYWYSNDLATAGNLATAYSDLYHVTVAAPAQDILKITTVQAGAPNAGGFHAGFALRGAGLGDDTLTNDAALLGVLLRRAS